MADKELTPAQAEAVRRLLEESRHDQPIPEVVARHLDDVVAGLAADRAQAAPAGPAGATVVPFRQRRWPKVLVAAAAVSALGLGITQVLDGVGSSGSDDDGGVAADQTVADQPADAGGDDGQLLGESPRAPAPNAPPSADGPAEQEVRDALTEGLSGYLELNRAVAAQAIDRLGSTVGGLQPLPRRQMRGALRALADSVFGPAPKHDAGYDLVTGNLSNTRATYDAPIAPRECGPIYTVVGGKATYARYHRKLALVLFHPEVNGAQLVELYVCSGKTPRRSVERVTLWDGE